MLNWVNDNKVLKKKKKKKVKSFFDIYNRFFVRGKYLENFFIKIFYLFISSFVHVFISILFFSLNMFLVNQEFFFKIR